ncbi:MAG: ABC transporter substrate-binding protein [Deltaproteobacteria bacterium]|nr:ABC transporter substrate-binding protein [Deltaproteobacteria bacterium]
MAASLTHVTIAHSPDADDAFMFYALATGKVGSPDIHYTHELIDIQTLNEYAKTARYDVTALSVHAYAYVADRYALLRSGASMGEATYGPMIVARSPMDAEALRRTTIAVPGQLTTAYLALQLALGPVETTTMRFDAILPAVRDGHVAAGLLIHEGQLTFAKDQLVNVFDLAGWWHARHRLPLPLGVNGIRRNLPAALQQTVAHDVRASIEYALAHRPQAVDHARQFARDLPTELIDRFVGMYVNQRTVRMGAEEELAITTLLREAHAAQLIPALPPLMWSE